MAIALATRTADVVKLDVRSALLDHGKVEPSLAAGMYTLPTQPVHSYLNSAKVPFKDSLAGLISAVARLGVVAGRARGYVPVWRPSRLGLAILSWNVRVFGLVAVPDFLYGIL